MMNNKVSIANGGSVDWSSVPLLEEESFGKYIEHAVRHEGMRCSAHFAVPENGKHRIVSVLGNPAAKSFEVISMSVADKEFVSLTDRIPALHLFEREIYEQYGLVPIGHPWLKPVRFEDTDPAVVPPEAAAQGEFFQMAGEAVHEVAVGPVHAGVIEPGHFRFQCMGEKVYSLEISLGYQHRGIEKMLCGKISPKTIHLIETAAGDSTTAAASAFAAAVEGNNGIMPVPAARILRAVAVELERIANHVGDLGALAGDVAFLPTASFCGRIRGEYLNMTAAICGNRFGRGIVRPGSCGVNFDKKTAEHLLAELKRVYPELLNALNLMFESPTVLDRFENTGTVDAETASALGGVGTAARASGIKCDARKDFPAGNYGINPPEPAFDEEVRGDVLARAMVRFREIKESHEWLFAVLKEDCEIKEVKKNPLPELMPGKLSIGVAEAWRGEYVCILLSDAEGGIRKIKIVDPSFHNWSMLAMALRNGEISNFPVCNKSFNLSYCGHDL